MEHVRNYEKKNMALRKKKKLNLMTLLDKDRRIRCISEQTWQITNENMSERRNRMTNPAWNGSSQALVPK